MYNGHIALCFCVGILRPLSLAERRVARLAKQVRRRVSRL